MFRKRKFFFWNKKCFFLHISCNNCEIQIISIPSGVFIRKTSLHSRSPHSSQKSWRIALADSPRGAFIHKNEAASAHSACWPAPSINLSHPLARAVSFIQAPEKKNERENLTSSRLETLFFRASLFLCYWTLIFFPSTFFFLILSPSTSCTCFPAKILSEKRHNVRPFGEPGRVLRH